MYFFDYFIQRNKLKVQLNISKKTYDEYLKKMILDNKYQIIF